MAEDTIKLYEFDKREIVNALGVNRENFLRYLDNEDLGKCFNITDGNVHPSSWVGVVHYQNKQIEILPKFLNISTMKNEENDVNHKDVLSNLIFMLSFVHKLEIKTDVSDDLEQSNNPFLEILIREFSISLFDALKRQTLRNYVREENNLRYIKGKIKISDDIRYNCCNRTKFYCEYDEFSENNILNQLFLFVASVLYTISGEQETKQILGHIKNYYADVSFCRFNKEMVKKIILGRNQLIFKKPFQLACMFVRQLSLDLTNNNVANISLLWDMNILFEEFVFEIMRSCCKNDSYCVTPQYGKRLVVYKGKKRKDTYVDILAQNKTEKIIIDTKYKKVLSIDDIKNGDIYQVTTYCVLHGSHRAVLIYPQWLNAELDEQSFLNTACQEKYEIDFLTLNLTHNLSDRNNFNKLVEKINTIFA